MLRKRNLNFGTKIHKLCVTDYNSFFTAKKSSKKVDKMKYSKYKVQTDIYSEILQLGFLDFSSLRIVFSLHHQITKLSHSRRLIISLRRQACSVIFKKALQGLSASNSCTNRHKATKSSTSLYHHLSNLTYEFTTT